MRTEAGVTTGRWMRLVLLCCTLVGLAAMHTLGHGAHASDSHGAHASDGPGAHASAPAEHLADAVVEMAAGAVSGHVVDMAGVAVSGHGSNGAAGALPVVPKVASASGRTVDCAGDGCGAALAVPLGPSGGDPAGWSVCLAVLGGFALVLLVVVLLRRRPVGVRPAVGSSRVKGPRAPPPRPVGLRLATASVLRR
ncbi:hypothetical protein MRQ36_15610 [Micromonospora sp. R77]|uniref:hypothetical protein n=1 Tax=Micromonospora sp. R77 TaxID=2925836 RepID=UPI001F61C725|nr:hypothetical protein [Micromonospora sp. R77]MCI4063937.1 hypothetical protein [Micromonospora sp. R77]